MDGGLMNEDVAGAAHDSVIDLPQLLKAVAARKKWIIAATLAAFSVALAVVILLPPRYTGVAKVLLENQESYYTRPDKAGAEQAVIAGHDWGAPVAWHAALLRPDRFRAVIDRVARR